MCASFQLIASYTSHWTWGVRFYEDSRNFSLTLPNGNEESALAKHPADFLLLLSTADKKCVWEKSDNFFESFPHTSLPRIWEPFWRRDGKLFWQFFCSHSLLEARCPSGPLCGKFFFFTYMGEMSTPSLLLPTGGKAAAWTKKGCCYPNLFLTDLSGQEKVKWPKKSKNRKNSPITEKTMW